jgi:hypothetical protein
VARPRPDRPGASNSFDGAIAASNDRCGLLDDAGQLGGNNLARVVAEACSAKAIGMLVADAQAMAR